VRFSWSASKPIDGAELLIAIIAQIKDSDNADRDESLNFSLTMLFQELLSSSGKSCLLKGNYPR
jgi:hypothetical protein